MPSQPPIPPLLSPLLQTPPKSGSLSLLTSVLSASTNWLVLRFVYTALREKSLNNDGTTGEVGVLMISWLRSLELWRDMGRKLGVDFSRSGKLSFLNGLGINFGKGVKDVEKEILNTVQRLKNDKGQKVLVVLDGVDFLAAAMGAEVIEVLDMVTEIREHVHAVIVTASADSPLMQARNTPLEVNHSALVMSFVHQATAVCAVRGLETGAARDISGILRIGRGAGEGSEKVEEMEVLYFVEADGGVRVFERGK